MASPKKTKDKKVEETEVISEKKTSAVKKEVNVVEEKRKESPQEKKVKKPVKDLRLLPKEALLLKDRKCFFVEKLKGKIVVRFLDGGYALVEEKDLTPA